jgi:hypothetical protein
MLKSIQKKEVNKQVAFTVGEIVLQRIYGSMEFNRRSGS